MKKEGPALDLPIAIGLLRGTNFIQNDRHKEFLIAGELALDGRLRKIKGALSLALLARDEGIRGVILPEENAREAAVVEGIEVYPVATLSQAVSFLNEQLPLEPYELDGEAYQASKLVAGARLRRRARAGGGEAGDHHRRRRLAQPADGRPAGHRQDDARASGSRASCRRCRGRSRWRRRGSTRRWGCCPTASR